MKKIKQYLKEDKWFILGLLILAFLFNYELPYYINTPGGTISINNRIDCDTCSKINGELNMLYVSEYEATIPLYLLSYIIPNWDLEKISSYQISDETTEEIYERNRLMLENSIDNAVYVAYKEAKKTIEVKSKKTEVLAKTLKSKFKIGDEILEVNDKKIDNVSEIKQIINEKNVGDEIKFKIKRNNKEKEINVKVREENKTKLIGVIITTDFEYDIDPKIDIKFKTKEAGSSGGLMMALSIYTKITKEDIVKGRKIAGTGTIEGDGTVGEIDGIKYKIMGAANNNIDIVLVPKENYKEAMKVKKDNNYDLKIVKVETFKEALDYLKQ